MRLAVASLALLAALRVSLTAHAAPVDQIAISGTDSYRNPYTIDFNLDPTSPYTSPYANNFSFSNVQGTVDGVTDTFTVSFTPLGLDERINLTDAGLLDQVFLLSSTSNLILLAGTPNGTAPTINLATYSGNNETSCNFSQVARPTTLAMPALAFFQIPTITTICGSVVSVTATGATTTVTPEPSTIALLGTGMLGVFGITRRRFFSKS